MLNPGRWLLLAIVLSLAAGYGGRRYRSHRETVVATPGVYADPAYNLVAPAGVRIKVEVLNASDARGLARRAALYLRDRGFDVVYFGNTTERRDSTLVLDRSDHHEWAALVARALKGQAITRPDSSRYLDVTVLLGASWRPPPRPFYP